MKKSAFMVLSVVVVLFSCAQGSSKKRNLDETLFKYASLIRWSDYDQAIRFLKPGSKDIIPSNFELEHLKQFKVSRYLESPITPGANENSIQQTIEIQLYNIHNNAVRTLIDQQTWEYDDTAKQWYLISGIPKI